MSSQLDGGFPVAIKILGEDLVVFRDLSQRVGVLHKHCAHRRASLEFGRIENQGIRCCYHGMKIVGKGASAVLSQATSLNLHKFQSGFAAATEVFSLAAIILRDGTDEFSVYIERSYAAYVWNRLSVCALQEQHVSSF